MATLVLEPTRRRITVDQFFEEVGETEERFELIDGEIWQMAGGSIEHAAICLDIATALRVKLRGTPCRPLGSDAAVQLDEFNFRYPDVTIACDPRDISRVAMEGKRRLHHPKVVFEVLSPSTARTDRAIKVGQYKALPSITVIVLVDLAARTIELHERTGPAAWTQREVAAGDDLVLTDPALTLTAVEIFGDA